MNMIQKKKNKKIIIVIVVIVLVVLLAGGIGIVSLASAMNAGAVVTVAKPERGELQESISTSGIVKSGEVQVIFSEVNGKVSEVAVAAGDAVENGQVLVNFDMTAKEKDLKLAALELAKSNAGYNGVMADNAESNADLREADINLEVLEQQIADNKAYLKDLQKKLKEDQRETGNELAGEAYKLTKDLEELKAEAESLPSVSGNDLSATEKEQVLAKSAELEEKMSEINSDLARNSYLQSIAGSSDYVAELEEEIEDVQERIAEYEEYKAEMEGQKNGSEGSKLDVYDRQQYEADHELAGLSYEDAELEYYLAKQGVLASFDGVITECSVVEGSTITEGTQLFTLESSESVKVAFDASKYDVEKLAIGQKVDVKIMGYEYEGEISKINRMTTINASNTPMVGVEVSLLNPDEKIILGLDAKLTVYTAKVQDALLIPVEAVNADKDGDFLYVVEDGKVSRRPVVCGISTDEQIEILEGITEADEVILTSFTTLAEGMPVTVMPEM